VFSPDESWHGGAGASLHGAAAAGLGGSLHGAASLGGSAHGGAAAAALAAAASAQLGAGVPPGLTASGGSGHGGTGVRGESAHGGSMFGATVPRTAPASAVAPAAPAAQPVLQPPPDLLRSLTLHTREEAAARERLINTAAPIPAARSLTAPMVPGAPSAPDAAPAGTPPLRPRSFIERRDVVAAEAAAAAPLPPPPGAVFPAPGCEVPRVERVSGSAPVNTNHRLLQETLAAEGSLGEFAVARRGSGESEPAADAPMDLGAGGTVQRM
jgi:hypothetical protein